MSTSSSTLDAETARYELYELMASELPFEQKAEQALELGERMLGVENGHLTRIEQESNFWKAIVSTDPPDGQFPPDLVLDLETTYCRRTIEQDDPVTLHDAPEQGWDDDAAFEEHGLHCYHGTVITLGDETYGTVCFVSEDPRSDPFASDETLFAELISKMLEHEIEQQRTRKKIEQLDQFAAAVSHDLRNPLNVAKLRVDAERETTDTENLQKATDALDRIERLITDILDIARGTEPVEDTVRVDLTTIATESWETVRTDEAELQLDGDCQFQADPNRLQRLFENLFRNAIEHGSQNGIVRVGDLEDGFYVADDGPGIPPEDRNKVFDSGFSKGEDGIGLGLAIVDSVVTAHDWAVTVTESDDGGARFDISDVPIGFGS
jgi:GAF domain-containing protein